MIEPLMPTAIFFFARNWFFLRQMATVNLLSGLLIWIEFLFSGSIAVCVCTGFNVCFYLTFYWFMKFPCIILTFSVRVMVENWISRWEGTAIAVLISLQTERPYLHQRTVREVRVHLASSVLFLQQGGHYPFTAMEVTFLLWNSHAEGLKNNAHFSLTDKI